MFDVFTEEIEVAIKDGIANLYWYRGDLKKAWLRSGVDSNLADTLYQRSNPNGTKVTKRQMMDLLYEDLRNRDFNRRLEISRNFVRILVEHKNFVPQNEMHRIEIAERCALKLREITVQQQKDREYREQIRRRAQQAKKEDYYSGLQKVRDKFVQANEVDAQKRGCELERVFTDLMRISGIPVQEPFSAEGEQLDGAIKYDGRYYLIELKWRKEKTQPKDIGSFYFKVEGKMDARGIFISMNGYTKGALTSVPKGKELRVLLLDGNHFANVIFGIYTFQELLEHAISRATLKGNIYCSHNLGTE